MKKTLTAVLTAAITACTAASALAANVTLYSLDNRTIEVDESQVAAYTAEGMGWFKDKPVEMYAADGRTITVRADKVEDYKKVGWFVKAQTSADAKTDDTKTDGTKTDSQTPASDKVTIMLLPNGPIITVPAYQLEMYKALGWDKTDTSAPSEPSGNSTVTVYNEAGESKVISESELSKYLNAGWTKTKPDGTYVTVYDADGNKKDILSANAEAAKSEGWYAAYDEAVYAYAAFGKGDVRGATQLLEAKKYEAAFEMVQNAITKLEKTESEYVSMLYYLRTQVTDSWRTAANSPLGFINYWFADKDGKKLIVLEYRNVSNSRIQSFKVNFDICDAAGNVVETNSGSYFVEKLEMTPCESKRAAWVVKNGSVAAGIKNLKVLEVVFSDGTSWKA